MLARQPQAMQLRYLQTLTTIAGDKSSTIVFPLPIDLIGPLVQAVNEHVAEARAPLPPEAGTAPDRTANGPQADAIQARSQR